MKDKPACTFTFENGGDCQCLVCLKFFVFRRLLRLQCNFYNFLSI